jgi:hypothetical protein
MLDTLPQWMQDSWPWLIWTGAFGVVMSIIFDVAKRYKRLRDHSKSAIDD